MSRLTFVNTKVREASLSMVVTRSDGTVQDLGVVAYAHKSGIRARFINLLIAIKRSVWTG